MFGHTFYNSTLKKYQEVFATIFNDIIIERVDDKGKKTKDKFKVPIDFAPRQKYLAMFQQDPNKDRQISIKLPLMSYEISNITYDSLRKENSNSYNKIATGVNKEYLTKYAPVPYNIDFTLQIYTKYVEDGYQIIEQILPFFTPEWTSSVYLLDGIDKKYDIPIFLNTMTCDDVYEGNFIEPRSIIWTLTFTLYGYFFGPTYEKKVIKFIKTNFYDNFDKKKPNEYFTIQPGMTPDNKPTTDINKTIDWQKINKDDNWDYITLFKNEKDDE